MDYYINDYMSLDTGQSLGAARSEIKEVHSGGSLARVGILPTRASCATVRPIVEGSSPRAGPTGTCITVGFNPGPAASHNDAARPLLQLYGAEGLASTQFVELIERRTLLKTSRAIDVVGSLVAITRLP